MRRDSSHQGVQGRAQPCGTPESLRLDKRMQEVEEGVGWALSPPVAVDAHEDRAPAIEANPVLRDATKIFACEPNADLRMINPGLPVAGGCLSLQLADLLNAICDRARRPQV